MSKFTCRCGNIINLSNGWSDSEWIMFPQQIIEDVGEKIDAEGVQSSDQFYKIIDSHSLSLYRCNVCLRVHIQGANDYFDSYAKESS